MMTTTTAMRVLIVEDDPATSTLVAELLEADGLGVVRVRDGEQAQAWLRDHCPDAVVLDLMLPGVDGLTILRQMRERLEQRDVPVVVVTARTDDDTAWAAWQAGCDYHMTKPFEPATLCSVVDRLLGRWTRAE